MVLILPDDGQYQAFEDALTAAGSIRSSLIYPMRHSSPSPYRNSASTRATTSTRPFRRWASWTPSRQAQPISRDDGTKDGVPWIDLVVHKAYIEINEYGTLAFAGTGMEMTLVCTRA